MADSGRQTMMLYGEGKKVDVNAFINVHTLLSMCIDEFEVESQVSSPDHVDIVHSLVELTSLKIDQAFIGFCAISTKTLPSSFSFTS